jgi:O-antigen/teichoic acid export membrane protein
MLDRLNVRKNVIATIVAFAVNVALVFLSYRLVILTGGIHTLGLWSNLTAWIFIIRLGDIGMAMAVVRFVARCDSRVDTQEIREYTDTALLVNIIVFLCLSVAGFIVYDRNLNSIVAGNEEALLLAHDILPLMFVGFFLSNISGQIIGGLTGIHRGYQSAVIGIIGTTVQLLVVLWIVPRNGLIGLAWGLITQHLFVALAGWSLFIIALTKESGRPVQLAPVFFSIVALRQMLGYSAKLQIVNIVNGLLEPLSKIIIGRTVGFDVLGVYEIAYKVVSLPRNAVVSGVQALVAPLSSLLVGHRKEARDLFDRSDARLIKSTLAVSCFSILISPIASLALLGEINHYLFGFSAILAIGFLGNVFGATSYILCVAVGKIRFLMLSAITALSLVLILVPLGGQIFGAFGSVSGVAVALTAAGLIIRYISKKIWEA